MFYLLFVLTQIKKVIRKVFKDSDPGCGHDTVKHFTDTKVQVYPA